MSGDQEVVTFEAGGLSWRAEPAASETVRREIADRIDELDRMPGAELIKRNMVRAVWRVPLSNGRRVIVKRYRVSGMRDWVTYVVRDSRALTEWRVGRDLDAAGIPTAVPLAYAERHVGGVLRDAALVTREIADAVHLNAYVAAHFAGMPERDGLRAVLFDELGRLVRRIHDAGFIHNDFHGGNLLVSGPPERPSLHVIDLHSVARHDHPPERSRWADLVKLLHSMLSCSTETERRRICEMYEAAGPSGTRVSRLLASGRLTEALEPALVRMERRRVQSRTDRSLARSSKFEVSSVRGHRVHHLRIVDPESVVALLDPHARDLRERAPNVLKDGRRSGITRQTLEGPDGPRPVVVKEYRGRGIVDRAKNAVRTPRAVSAWVAGNGLLVRGFDAAMPLALVLRGRGPALRGAWLVMEDLGDGTRADLVALSRYAGDLGKPARQEKAALVRAAADLVRRLHETGVYHGDLKAVNLFLRGAPTERPPRIALADYDRVEFDRPVGVRRRVKNLAQLSASVPVCVTLADRLRFFRDYARTDAAAADWKTWFRRVAEEQSRKIVVRMRPIE
jgi:tRNA A-37 threonylcarbamoyl transferase component Bud32